MSIAEGFKQLEAEETAPLLRLDLGCGANRYHDQDDQGTPFKPGEDGYLGEWTSVDILPLEGVDVVANLCEKVYEFQFRGVVQGPEGEENVYEKIHTGYKPWPWEDNSVDAIHAGHFIEHFGGWDRVHIYNEIYRVLKSGAKAKIICPSWTSARAYGDPTHVWAPIGLYGFYYLDRNWRMGGKMGGQPVSPQAPHTDAEHVQFGFDCDFEFTAVAGMHGELLNYAAERQAHMLQFNIEAAQDIHCTLTKRARSW